MWGDIYICVHVILEGIALANTPKVEKAYPSFGIIYIALNCVLYIPAIVFQGYMFSYIKTCGKKDTSQDRKRCVTAMNILFFRLVSFCLFQSIVALMILGWFDGGVLAIKVFGAAMAGGIPVIFWWKNTIKYWVAAAVDDEVT